MPVVTHISLLSSAGTFNQLAFKFSQATLFTTYQMPWWHLNCWLYPGYYTKRIWTGLLLQSSKRLILTCFTLPYENTCFYHHRAAGLQGHKASHGLWAHLYLHGLHFHWILSAIILWLRCGITCDVRVCSIFGNRAVDVNIGLGCQGNFYSVEKQWLDSSLSECTLYILPDVLTLQGIYMCLRAATLSPDWLILHL